MKMKIRELGLKDEYKIVEKNGKKFLRWRGKSFGPYNDIEKVIVDKYIVYQADDSVYISGKRLRKEATLEIVVAGYVVISYQDALSMLAVYDLKGKKILEAEREDDDIEDGCIYLGDDLFVISLRYTNYHSGKEYCMIYTNNNEFPFEASQIVYQILDVHKIDNKRYLFVYTGFGTILECGKFLLKIDDKDCYIVKDDKVEVYNGSGEPYLIFNFRRG